MCLFLEGLPPYRREKGLSDSESHYGSISPWQAAPAVSEPPGSRQRGGAIDPGFTD